MSTIPSMVQPSAVSTAAFVLIVIGLGGLLVLALGRAAPGRTGASVLGVLAWLGLTGLASGSGILEREMLPPPAMLFFFVSNLAAFLLAFSPVGTRIVEVVPVAWLVGFQAFRLPLELVLHRWAEEGVLPVQMTYSGHNFDIVTGVLALVVGAWAWRSQPPRWALWAFNCIGLGLLMTVAAIAVMSSPIPLRTYMNDPPVLLAYHFPYGWIVPVCVAGALCGHLLTFRWLLRPR